MKKRVLSLLLAAVMCLSLLPAAVFAEETEETPHEHSYEAVETVLPGCTEQGYKMLLRRMLRQTAGIPAFP